jgi:hypothetical protein
METEPLSRLPRFTLRLRRVLDDQRRSQGNQDRGRELCQMKSFTLGNVAVVIGRGVRDRLYRPPSYRRLTPRRSD